MGRSGHIEEEKPKENGQADSYGEDHKPVETTAHASLSKVSCSPAEKENLNS